MARSDAVELWSVSHCTAHGAWRDFVSGGAESRSCRRYEYVCVRVWGRLAEGSRHRPTTPRALGSGTLCLQGARQSLGVMRCVVWSLVCWAGPKKIRTLRARALSPRSPCHATHTHTLTTHSVSCATSVTHVTWLHCPCFASTQSLAACSRTVKAPRRHPAWRHRRVARAP